MANKKNEVIVKEDNKPARGRGGKRNFPSAKMAVETDEDKALVGKLLSEVLVEYNQEKVKNDEELAERLNNYFYRCAENGQVPTVEEMCLSTGYAYSTCYDWETGRRKGFSNSTAEIIKKAKEMLKTFDAKLVIAGKLNFLAYCFRAKNYYGMVDKQEMVLTPNTNNEQEYDVDAIKKRLSAPDSTLVIDSEEVED